MQSNTCSADFVIDEMQRLDKQLEATRAVSTESDDDSPTEAEARNTIGSSKVLATVDDWKSIFLSSPYGMTIASRLSDIFTSKDQLQPLTPMNSKKAKTWGHAFVYFWWSVFILCKVWFVHCSRAFPHFF